MLLFILHELWSIIDDSGSVVSSVVSSHPTLLSFHMLAGNVDRALSTQRKQYSAEFKTRVALEALKGLKTVNELASTYGVHPTQIAHWKHRLQKEMPEIFSARRAKREHDAEAFQAQLYQQIGQLKVELDWMKKKAGLGS